MRNFITSQEAFYSDNEQYASCSGSSCETLLPGFNASKGVEIEVEEDIGGYQAFSAHCKGDKGYSFQNFSEDESNYNKILAGEDVFEDFCGD